ncbi:MAG: hypothetical protein LBS21_02860 [Clostridiales bacterium]|jgi:long-subunit acyl-CoA synthetase (AMP-forming)|nr:hypothetical protein [Clostridiales bacterium]
MKKCKRAILVIIAIFMLSVSPVYAMMDIYSMVVQQQSLASADIFEWVFKIENGKYYKRLYNSTTGQWIGDWILVA